jgi:hypothetical protein
VSAARTAFPDAGVNQRGGPSSTRRDGAILLALVVALGVPFWGKAFHIDDPFFIAIALNLRLHPLRPFDGAVALDDTDHRVFARVASAPNTFETLSHPPLVPYVIAATSVASGGLREVPQHAAFLLFSGVAAWFQYRLARRFTKAPLLAALLLVACPVFILGGHGLMTDVPAIALFLAALALFIEGADSGDVRRLLLAGTVAGFAVLTRYTCLGLVPLAAFYALGRSPRPSKAAWVALLPFSALLGLWCLQNLLAHGGIHLAASARHYAEYYEGRYFTFTDLGRRAISDLAALGGALLPIAAAIMTPGGDRGRIARVLSCALAAGLAVWLDPFGIHELGDYSAGQKIALALFLAGGLLLLIEAGRRARPWSSDRVFLLVWMAAGLLATVVLLPFGAARYLIPILPPLFLLLCAGSGTSDWTGRARAKRWAVGITLGLGVLLAIADQQYAGVYRDFARRGVPAVAGSHRVFFIGDWGFRLYMEEAGHLYLRSIDETPAPGDFVIRPQVAGLHEMAPGLRARTQREATIPLMSLLPVRVMSYEAKAGYYSHGWGLLPFAVSRAPLERFDVYRVVAPPS